MWVIFLRAGEVLPFIAILGESGPFFEVRWDVKRFESPFSRVAPCHAGAAQRPGVRHQSGQEFARYANHGHASPKKISPFWRLNGSSSSGAERSSPRPLGRGVALSAATDQQTKIVVEQATTERESVGVGGRAHFFQKPPGPLSSTPRAPPPEPLLTHLRAKIESKFKRPQVTLRLSGGGPYESSVCTAVSRAKNRGAPASVFNIKSSNVTLNPAEGGRVRSQMKLQAPRNWILTPAPSSKFRQAETGGVDLGASGCGGLTANDRKSMMKGQKRNWKQQGGIARSNSRSLGNPFWTQRDRQLNAQPRRDDSDRHLPGN